MNIIKKNAQGYGYTYTDLAEITKLLAENGITYYQYIEPCDGVDYIMTVSVKDGKESEPIRGCRVVEATLSGKSNPAQEYGAALTYCRRYSLLMAFGLATTDDDAACLTQHKKASDKPSDKVSDKQIRVFEIMCRNRGIEPDSLFDTGYDYHDMSPETFTKIMRKWGK